MSTVQPEVVNVAEDDEPTVSEPMAAGSIEKTYEEKVANCTIIAKPMASKRLAKKCYKLVKKARKHKSYIRCGLKDVQKHIRKGETGIVLFAGDVRPIEIMCHLPAVCEEKDIPYVFVPSREDLGISLSSKKSCLMVMVRRHRDYEEEFIRLRAEIYNLSIAL